MIADQPRWMAVRHRAAMRAHVAALVLGEGLLAASFLALTLAVVYHAGPLPGDVAGALAVQHALSPHPRLTALIELASTVNWPVPAGATVATVVLLMLALRRWLDALAAFAVSAVGDLSTYLLNQFVQRPRPAGHGIVVLSQIRGTFSFPSGHVVHAVAFFGFLLFLSFQTRRWPRLLWVVRIALLALILLMAPSRLLEGEHWPSDVLAGLLLGGCWLVLACAAYAWGSVRWPGLLAPDERRPRPPR